MRETSGLGPVAPAALVLAALMLAFIVYGSLYPFGFRPLPEGLPLGRALLAAWHRPVGSRGDLATNLVLYLPLGLALVAALPRVRPALAIGFAVFVCAVVSAGLEMAQLYVPGRTASAWDLLLNTTGSAVGAVMAALTAPALTAGGLGRPLSVEPAAALLLACWLGYRLYPYVPALDLGEWRASLRPLLAPAELEPWRALRLAVLWLVAARLLQAASPRSAGLPLVAAMILGTLAAAIPIVDRRLTPADLAGGLLALAIWPWLAGRSWTDYVLLALLFVVTAAEGAAPFRLLDQPRPFEWIPFRSVMRGEWGTGLQALLLKSLLYGGLIWLGCRAGLRLGLAAAAAVMLAAALSWLQTWLPGRSAEVTDAVLAGVMAGVIRSTTSTFCKRDAEKG